MSKENLSQHEPNSDGLVDAHVPNGEPDDLSRRELRQKVRSDQKEKETQSMQFFMDLDKALDFTGNDDYIYQLSEVKLEGCDVSYGVTLTAWEGSEPFEFPCAFGYKTLTNGEKEYQARWTDQNGIEQSMTSKTLIDLCAPIREELKRIERAQLNARLDDSRHLRN